jgi:hypothetical protein
LQGIEFRIIVIEPVQAQYDAGAFLGSAESVPDGRRPPKAKEEQDQNCIRFFWGGRECGG